MKSLPKSWKKKPSLLIKEAVRDNLACEKSKRYRVNMGGWHYRDNDNCSVCFAGGVIAKKLGADWKENLDPSDFDSDTEDMLDSLNSFRSGDIESGLDYLGLDVPFGLVSHVNVTSYETNPKDFRKDMLKIADLLEVSGL